MEIIFFFGVGEREGGRGGIKPTVVLCNNSWARERSHYGESEIEFYDILALIKFLSNFTWYFFLIAQLLYILT